MSWLSPANIFKKAHCCSKTCCTDPIACHSQARRAHEHCARSTSRNSNWDRRLIRQLDATFLHVVQNCEQSRTFQSLTASAVPLQVLLCAISIKFHAGVTQIKLRQNRTAGRFINMQLKAIVSIFMRNVVRAFYRPSSPTPPPCLTAAFCV